MADHKLKSCPFCGGEAALVEGENERFVVSCKSLECRGFSWLIYFKDAKEAIEAWNRRVDNED